MSQTEGPDVYDQQIERAERFAEVGQDARAMRILTDLLAHFPEHEGNTRQVLAWAHIREDRYDEALTHARRTVALSPESAAARYTLGAALWGLDEDEAAERVMRECLALDPTHGGAHAVLARMLAGSTKRQEEAVAHAREAVRLDPANSYNQASLAIALGTSDADGAEAALQEAIRLDPTSTQILVNIAIEQNRHGRPLAAIRTAASVVACDPANPASRQLMDTMLYNVVRDAQVSVFLGTLLALPFLGLGFFFGIGNALAAAILGITALRTVHGTYRRVRAFATHLPHHGTRVAKSFVRRSPLNVVWAAVVAVVWVGLILGIVGLLMGTTAPLRWAVLAGVIDFPLLIGLGMIAGILARIIVRKR